MKENNNNEILEAIERRIDTLVTMLQNRNLLASSDVKLLSDLHVFPHIGE